MLEGWCGEWTFHSRKEIVAPAGCTQKQAGDLHIFGRAGRLRSCSCSGQTLRLLSSPIGQELSILSKLGLQHSASAPIQVSIVQLCYSCLVKMIGTKAWRPIASKITLSSLPRIVRVSYSTDPKIYDFIKVSSPKPGVGLSKAPIRAVFTLHWLVTKLSSSPQ